MGLSGVKLGRRRLAELDALVTAVADERLTYDHVGSTLVEGSDTGRPDRHFTLDVLGDLSHARSTLRRWAPHGGIGRIHPPDAIVATGTTLLVVASWGPFQMAVPDRVVAVIDEPDRFGFAYGTLRGHAEVGEEAFVAERLSGGGTRLRIRVQASPATVLARLGGPLVTFLQKAAATRYLQAWAAAIAEEAT